MKAARVSGFLKYLHYLHYLHLLDFELDFGGFLVKILQAGEDMYLHPLKYLHRFCLRFLLYFRRVQIGQVNMSKGRIFKSYT